MDAATVLLTGPNPESLADRRRREREKYQAVLRRHMRYGSSNHGAQALALLQRERTAAVLDVGCGDNQFVRALRGMGLTAVGVDFVHPGADLRAAAHALPFADRSFEWVTAFDVLEHLLPEEVEPVLAELARVSRVGWVFSIAYRDSRVRGPGGETLHPTVRPESWWRERLDCWIRTRREGRFLWGRLHGFMATSCQGSAPETPTCRQSLR